MEGVLAVAKNEVNFRLFKGRRQVFLWNPLTYGNLFMAAPPEEILDLMKRLSKHVTKECFETATLDLYSFSQDLQEDFLALDDEWASLRYHPYDESLKHFLLELTDFRAGLRESTRALGSLEWGRKRLHLLLLYLGPREALLLQEDEEARRLLADLLRTSGGERLYLQVFLEEASSLPVGLLQAFDSSLYLGESNEAWATQAVHPSWEVEERSLVQQSLGLYTSLTFPQWKQVYNFRRVLTPWGEARKKLWAEEAALYEEFLSTLDDGS